MLREFKLFSGDELLYEGRSVTTQQSTVGTATLVTHTLVDPFDFETRVAAPRKDLKKMTADFLSDLEENNRINPEFKLIVEQLRSFFLPLAIG